MRIMCLLLAYTYTQLRQCAHQSGFRIALCDRVGVALCMQPAEISIIQVSVPQRDYYYCGAGTHNYKIHLAVCALCNNAFLGMYASAAQKLILTLRRLLIFLFYYIRSKPFYSHVSALGFK
jgi:hypothetical protein